MRLPSLPSIGPDPRVAGAAAAAVLLLLVGAWSFTRMGTKKETLEAEITREVADSARMANTIALVERLAARRDTIEQRIGVIRQVDERRYVWPHLMDEISRSVPPFTWLLKLTSDDTPAEAGAPPPAPRPPVAGSAADTAKKDTVGMAAKARADSLAAGPSFTLEGATGSTQALTRFMKTLEASPMIRNVTLVTSAQASEEGRTFTKFTLEGRYERPDTALIETVSIVPGN